MTQTYLDREAPEEDIEYILFAPEAYRTRRGTAVRNAPAPARSALATPGDTGRHTPPPPPLNRDGEPIHYGSGVPARHPASRYPAVLGLDTLPFTEFTEPFVTDVGEESAGKWIKVVGVLKEDHPAIIRHFRKYGDLEKLSVPGSMTAKNWVFMKFKSEASAAMAVLSNCQTIECGKCFGVGLPSAAERRMLEAEEVPPSVLNAFAQSSLASDFDFVTQGSSAPRITAAPIVTPIMPATEAVPRYIPQPVSARGTNSFEYFWDFLFGR